MQIVITEGQIQLEPVPGSEEGSRSGYLLKVLDLETRVQVVVAMAHKNAAELGATLVRDTEEHPAAAAPVNLVVAGAGEAEKFKRLPGDHLKKGGVRR